MLACERDAPASRSEEVIAPSAAEVDVFGVRFGMSGEAFATLCREGNQAGFLRNGEGMQVRMELPGKDFPGNAYVDFYPRFTASHGVTAIPLQFSLHNYSPWDEATHADQIIPSVLSVLDSLVPGGPFLPGKDALGNPRFHRCAKGYQTVVRTSEERFVEVELALLTALEVNCLCCDE